MIKNKNKLKAFSLIELIVVLSIIAILSSFIVISLKGKTDQARRTKVYADFKAFETALTEYESHTGRFPTTEQGLMALVEKPKAGSPANWSGPYIGSKNIKDPWGNDYVYKYPSEKDSYSFEIISLAADNKVGGEGPNKDASSSE